MTKSHSKSLEYSSVVPYVELGNFGSLHKAKAERLFVKSGHLKLEFKDLINYS